MGLLENSIGAMFGAGPGGNNGPSFGGAPYAPLATALIGLLAAKAMSGGFGNLGGMLGGGQPAAVPQQTAPHPLPEPEGPEVIRQLAQKTGLSEQQIAQQLSQELPDIVNRLTPQGRLPTHQEASSFLNGSNPLNPA